MSKLEHKAFYQFINDHQKLRDLFDELRGVAFYFYKNRASYNRFVCDVIELLQLTNECSIPPRPWALLELRAKRKFCDDILRELRYWFEYYQRQERYYPNEGDVPLEVENRRDSSE